MKVTKDHLPGCDTVTRVRENAGPDAASQAHSKNRDHLIDTFKNDLLLCNDTGSQQIIDTRSAANSFAYTNLIAVGVILNSGRDVYGSAEVIEAFIKRHCDRRASVNADLQNDILFLAKFVETFGFLPHSNCRANGVRWLFECRHYRIADGLDYSAIIYNGRVKQTFEMLLH